MQTPSEDIPLSKVLTESQIRSQMKRFVLKHPEAAIDVLLEGFFWPKTIKTNTTYSRESDDTDGDRQGISVSFSEDADAWVEVTSFKEPREDDEGETDPTPRIFHRFRSGFGGGRSLRTRTALLVLARAIQLDSKDLPDR